MNKKVEDKKEVFDLKTELEKLPYPDWVRKAFIKQVNTNKIKNSKDLDKEFKKFMELK